jgi:Flp pilus assembly protein TadB
MRLIPDLANRRELVRSSATSCYYRVRLTRRSDTEGRRTAVRWFKVAAIAVGVVIAFLIVSSVVGFLVEAAIAVIVVAAIAFAVKVAVNRRQVSSQRRNREVRGPGPSRPLRRHDAADVDDELARLKRDTGA